MIEFPQLSEFFQKIRELRKKQGLTQNELANKSGISLRTYQRIESGEFPPKLDTTLRITKVLGVDTLSVLLNLLNGHSVGKGAEKDRVSDKIELTSLSEEPQEQLAASRVLSPEDIEKMKRMLSKMSLHLDSPKVGYWEWDLEDDAWFWSDEMYDLYEMPKNGEFSPKDVVNRIHPQDLPEMDESLTALVTKGVDYKNVHRVVCEGEGTRLIQANARVVSKENGQQVVFGIAEEILAS